MLYLPQPSWFPPGTLEEYLFEVRVKAPVGLLISLFLQMPKLPVIKGAWAFTLLELY